MQQTIHRILGANNILLIVPQGYNSASPEQEGNFLGDLALALSERLQCYAVVNTKYKKEIMDLADLRAIHHRPKVVEAFLHPINRFKLEIIDNSLIPLVLILQALPPDVQSDSMLVFGYGQGERGANDAPHSPTLPVSQLAKIRLSCEDNHLTTDIAHTDSPFCGREPYHLNQLFRSKLYPEYFAAEACSLILFVRHDLISKRQTALSIAEMLTKALAPFANAMPLVRLVDINNIDTDSAEDFQYIFRLQGDSRNVDLLREAYIEELAHSIDRNGLLHPLVLLKKKDGRYKILCGYRRYRALSRLNKPQVEAKIYQESDFSTEEFFTISLAENTKRRNLNPIEIGNFLESASTALGLNNAELAEQFGGTLGIGKPGQKVSHTTIHKYRKVNQMRIRGESPEIISDVINDNLQFSIASEVLAPIKNNKDRDSLYVHVIKPLNPTRPQISQIIKLLDGFAPDLHQAITSDKVQSILARARTSNQPAQYFLKSITSKVEHQNEEHRKHFDHKIRQLRKNVFGAQARKRDFNITLASPNNPDELIVQFKLKKGQTDHTLELLRKVLSEESLFIDP
jgi:ParB family chromosome partitioning protein